MGNCTSKKKPNLCNKSTVKVHSLNSVRSEIVNLIMTCTVELSHSKKTLDACYYFDDKESGLIVLKKQEYIKRVMNRCRKLVKRIDDASEDSIATYRKIEALNKSKRFLGRVDLKVIRGKVSPGFCSTYEEDNSALISFSVDADELYLHTKLFNFFKMKKETLPQGVFRQKFIKNSVK